MSLVATLVTRGESFNPPGPGDFNLPPVGSDQTFDFLGETMYVGVTKPIILLVVSAVVIFVFFKMTARGAIVPGKLQFVGESMYSAVRNSLGRDLLGQRDFMRFVPYLFTLFFFILLNNLFGSIPVIEFPTFSRAGMVYSLAALSWLIYNWVGIKAKGGLGAYLKHQCVPQGVPVAVLPLLIPLEFISNIIVRPVTLALRLFANMLAGHILLILFATGGEYLLVHGAAAIKPVGIIAWVLFIAVAFLEILVQFLQAYVFVLLNAMYIQGALADEH